METKLARISQLSKENPDMVFTSIGHLINKELLRECHEGMEGDKALGSDGISKEAYGEKLEENLTRLVERLKRKAYKPKPARIVEIRKENGKIRPLSIYCYEDKLVQEALRRVLEAVFEPHFYEEMMGFRPKRGCHKAIRKLNTMLEGCPTNYVLDADIKGFFQNLDHEWAVRFIESRIKDPNIIRLARRVLKSGSMYESEHEGPESGAGQGNICSPVIANIYLHYVLLWWFKEKVRPGLRGYSGIVLYADDFVVCFQYREDAEEFYKRLKHRMGYFGLSLEEEKSRLIEFGRYAGKGRDQTRRPETFEFLGFTHYCSQSRNGRFRVKRKTSRKKLAKKTREVHKRIKEMRHMPVKEIIGKLNQILAGHYQYYGITDNINSLSQFLYRVTRSLFHWLNRRSQRKSYTWKAFADLLKAYPLIQPRIRVSIYADN